MKYTLYMEYRYSGTEEYDDLQEAIARAQSLRVEHPDGAFSVSGEGIHLVVVDVPAEVPA